MSTSPLRAWLGAAGRGLGFAGALAACAATPPAGDARGEPARAPSRAAPPARDDGRWATEVRSPRPAEPAVEPDLARRCGAPDAALAAVAQRLADEHARGAVDLETPRVAFELRAAGSPYPWPRVFTLTGAALDARAATEPLERWLASFDDGGERRCGLGRATDARGATHRVAVAADVLADLAPLPVRTRTGAWLRLEAELLVPAAGAKVVLLGPRGRPRPVPTSLSDGRARATFALAEPGPWLVNSWPHPERARPVGEAIVHADVPPPGSTSPWRSRASGGRRHPARAGGDDRRRAREGVGRLAVDPELGALAAAHAEAMRAARRLGHDVGDGDLVARLAAADVTPRVAGENVAHAADVTRGHRVIWQSPSHRETLLDPRFDAVGVGLAPDPDGSTWLCEILAQR